jgi:hypothetical protein
MKQNSLANSLLRAFYWIGEKDRVDRPMTCLDFYSTWCFLPHSVKSGLIEAVDNDLIRFDHNIELEQSMASYRLGDEFPFVPGLTQTGHELIASTFGFKRQGKFQVNAGKGGPGNYWDGTDEFIGHWNKIKSSADESIRLTCETLTKCRDSSGSMVAYLLEGGGRDEIERHLAVTDEFMAPRNSTVQDIVDQVLTTFGVQSTYIGDKDEDYYFWLVSEISGPLPDELRMWDMSDQARNGDAHPMHDLVLSQDPPFAYCVWDEDTEQYKCMKITDGTGMKIDLDNWLGEERLDHVWPSIRYSDPLPILTSRPELITKTDYVASARIVPKFAEHDWKAAVEADDHIRLAEIVRSHHECGDKIFNNMILSEADLEQAYRIGCD